MGERWRRWRAVGPGRLSGLYGLVGFCGGNDGPWAGWYLHVGGLVIGGAVFASRSGVLRLHVMDIEGWIRAQWGPGGGSGNTISSIRDTE